MASTNTRNNMKRLAELLASNKAATMEPQQPQQPQQEPQQPQQSQQPQPQPQPQQPQPQPQQPQPQPQQPQPQPQQPQPRLPQPQLPQPQQPQQPQATQTNTRRKGRGRPQGRGRPRGGLRGRPDATQRAFERQLALSNYARVPTAGDPVQQSDTRAHDVEPQHPSLENVQQPSGDYGSPSEPIPSEELQRQQALQEFRGVGTPPPPPRRNPLENPSLHPASQLPLGRRAARMARRGRMSRGGGRVGSENPMRSQDAIQQPSRENESHYDTSELLDLQRQLERTHGVGIHIVESRVQSDVGAHHAVQQPADQNVHHQPARENFQQLARQINVDQSPPENVQEQYSPENPENVDQSPPENVDQSPPENVDQSPPENIDQSPPENVDQSPPENVQEQYSPENVDQSPPENVDQSPPENVDQSPPENEEQYSPENVQETAPEIVQQPSRMDVEEPARQNVPNVQQLSRGNVEEPARQNVPNVQQPSRENVQEPSSQNVQQPDREHESPEEKLLREMPATAGNLVWMSTCTYAANLPTSFTPELVDSARLAYQVVVGRDPAPTPAARAPPRRFRRIAESVPTTTISPDGTLTRIQPRSSDSSGSHPNNPHHIEIPEKVQEEMNIINNKLFDTFLEVNTTCAGLEAPASTPNSIRLSCTYKAMGVGADWGHMKPKPYTVILIVPPAYPELSPVIWFEEEVNEAEAVAPWYKGVREMFMQCILYTPAPISISEIAITWDECARNGLKEYAIRHGGGDFTTAVGVWESADF